MQSLEKGTVLMGVPTPLQKNRWRWWDVSNELLRDLAAADRAGIFGGTAQRVYRLA